ncbi:MAG: hypothetical protein ACKVQQ_23875 [Burkholderiales bacterium]
MHEVLAFAIVVAAWWVALLGRSPLLAVISLMGFGFVGGLMVFFGAISYWWDSGMRPGSQNPFLLLCGIATLVAQAVSVLRKMRRELDDGPREP